MTMSKTRQLLARLREGDESAMDSLLAKHLDWIKSRVRLLLGPNLRTKEQSDDLVQDAVVEFLRYGPRFVVSDSEQLRALLYKIVQNTIRDRHRFHHRAKRAIDKEAPLPRDSEIDLDAHRAQFTPPPDRVERDEMAHWIRLALRLLPTKDREAIVLRDWESLGFSEIGETLGIPENTARMRYQRAIGKLGKKVQQLKNGDLPSAIEE